MFKTSSYINFKIIDKITFFLKIYFEVWDIFFLLPTQENLNFKNRFSHNYMLLFASLEVFLNESSTIKFCIPRIDIKLNWVKSYSFGTQLNSTATQWSLFCVKNRESQYAKQWIIGLILSNISTLLDLIFFARVCPKRTGITYIKTW